MAARMMRRPTRLIDAYAWHRAALAGENPPTHEADPQCGWFRRRMVKDGPWVPASIAIVQVTDPDTGDLTEPERLVCLVNGQSRDAHAEWTWLASNPISEAEHAELVRRIAWAGSNDPTSPLLNPTAPIAASKRLREPIFGAIDSGTTYDWREARRTIALGLRATLPRRG